jgi:ABC-type uncharacterized transport system ATPase subunit
VKAVDGVDLILRRGRILGLIGPNGAGKTTLVNALAGFQRATAGRVLLAGEDITTWEPSEIARRARAHVSGCPWPKRGQPCSRVAVRFGQQRSAIRPGRLRVRTTPQLLNGSAIRPPARRGQRSGSPVR